MINKLAWNAFKKTGNIDTFIEFTKTKQVEEDILLGEKNGNNKNEGDNNSRK